MRNKINPIFFLAILPLILSIAVKGEEPSHHGNNHGHCTYNSVFWEGVAHENEDCNNFECDVCDEIVKKCECSDCKLCASEILKKCYEILEECKPCNNNCTNFNCHQCTINDLNQCGSTYPPHHPPRAPSKPNSHEKPKPHSHEKPNSHSHEEPKPHSHEKPKPHSHEKPNSHSHEEPKPHSHEKTHETEYSSSNPEIEYQSTTQETEYPSTTPETEREKPKPHSHEKPKPPHSHEKSKSTITQKRKPSPAPHTRPMPPKKSSMKPGTQQPPKTSPSPITTTVKPPHCSKTCLHPYQCLLSFECRCPCGDCGYAVDTLFKPCDLYELCPPDYLKVMYSCCCNTSTPVIEGGKIPAGCKCEEYHLTNILNYITNVKPKFAPLPAPQKIKKTNGKVHVPCNTTLTVPSYDCVCQR